jgi:hypothetical protein
MYLFGIIIFLCLFCSKITKQHKIYDMIRDFWVENYLSIRDRQCLDFTAKGPETEYVAEVSKGIFVYKLAVLFGANASGKSNILLALDKLFDILQKPKTEANQQIERVYPFVLTKNEPTKMHITFYAASIRYDYDVEFNSQYILKEVLNYYPKGSKTLFYERKFTNAATQADIKFGASLRLSAKTQESIIENTLNNHSVLSVCNKISFKEDIKPFKGLCDWISSHYHDIDCDSRLGIVEVLKNAYSDERRRKFYNIMLQKADLNIVNFKPIIEDSNIPTEVRKSILKHDMPEQVRETLLAKTRDNVLFTNSSESGTFDIPLELQSKGTQRFIQILDTLYNLISNSHVYFLDELGEDLHYDLLMYYISVFLFNSNKSQLIITSQETALLSQDLFNDNRGLVWFVEKDREKAASEYSRGDSYGLHKNLSLYNSYKIGRLGAKPEFGSIFIDLD